MRKKNDIFIIYLKTSNHDKIYKIKTAQLFESCIKQIHL